MQRTRQAGALACCIWHAAAAQQHGRLSRGFAPPACSRAVATEAALQAVEAVTLALAEAEAKAETLMGLPPNVAVDTDAEAVACATGSSS